MTHYIKQPLVSFTAAIILLFTLSNCEKVVDLPVYEYEPSIVIFGTLEPDSIPKIFVTETEAYYTYTDIETEYTLIKDAIVEISDGNNTWQLQPDSVQYLPPYRNFGGSYFGEGVNKNPYYANAFTSNMTLEAGEKYVVSVRKNGKTATAEATVLSPMQVAFKEIQNQGSDRFGLIDFDIPDKPYGQYYRTLVAFQTMRYECEINEENYDFAAIDSFSLYDYKTRGPYEFIEVDPYYQPTFIRSLDDVCFSSGNCSWMVNQSNDLDSVRVQVSIQLVDSNLMNYITQINYQEEVEYNPFLEPAPVDHPVENGLGILTSVATSKWETFWVKCQ